MGSSSSSSSSSSSGSNYSFIRNMSRSNEPLDIDFLNDKDLSEQIKEIQRIRIPFFDNEHLQRLSNIIYITGNSPFHEGLIIVTKNNYYITQTYPITFSKMFSYQEAIEKIKEFCACNKNSEFHEIKDVYIPKKDFLVKNIINIIKNLPNKYDIINNNCQTFCDSIINSISLKRKYKL